MFGKHFHDPSTFSQAPLQVDRQMIKSGSSGGGFPEHADARNAIAMRLSSFLILLPFSKNS